ncbi:fumarylacetoacetate hydrolase family protein [Sphingobium sp. SCG-1]|uniref:fumarylacetoacetate hydrolase family protein n=1 Tax=Sphingobium sp. SCG-1 TaxID=2072936 RepID=UPI001CB89B00|nr:fumarylacetoacetate hydrolase family protein [Sphingobium sp. SCG-1]
MSFTTDNGPSFGVLREDGIIDAGARMPQYADLTAALGDLPGLEALAGDPADYPLGSVKLLPPIPRSSRIICVGLNYKTHIAETGNEPPAFPSLFPRYPDSIVADGEPIIRPRVSVTLDFEGELAVVISKPGRNIPVDAALDHVAGYACFNDGSIREFQRHTNQVLPGKNFHRTGSFGPWLVTKDEAGDVNDLQLTTRLNGEIVQQSGVDDLLFGVEALIAYVSQIWEVQPGDVIVTGTPGGVGALRKPPLWMKPGDLVTVEIDRLGTLSNPVVAEEDLL